jgi:hypothetical protein
VLHRFNESGVGGLGDLPRSGRPRRLGETERGQLIALVRQAHRVGWSGRPMGREWRPKGEPVEVEDHHFFFTGPEVEQAIPYGIYDLTRNTGWVNVGVDHETSVFAVESIRRWWRARGRRDYRRRRAC